MSFDSHHVRLKSFALFLHLLFSLRTYFFFTLERNTAQRYQYLSVQILLSIIVVDQLSFFISTFACDIEIEPTFSHDRARGFFGYYSDYIYMCVYIVGFSWKFYPGGLLESCSLSCDFRVNLHDLYSASTKSEKSTCYYVHFDELSQ